jgi:hypothetical protein
VVRVPHGEQDRGNSRIQQHVVYPFRLGGEHELVVLSRDQEERRVARRDVGDRTGLDHLG